MTLLQGRFDRFKLGSKEETEENSPRPFPVGV
jgi:hypothetical protein